MPDQLVFKGTFEALHERRTSYLIDVFQTIHQGTNGPVPGRVVYRTADGAAVDRLLRGDYEVVGSGVLLRSVDPFCP
jgi:hypothetical protein